MIKIRPGGPGEQALVREFDQIPEADRTFLKEDVDDVAARWWIEALADPSLTSRRFPQAR